MRKRKLIVMPLVSFVMSFLPLAAVSQEQAANVGKTDTTKSVPSEVPVIDDGTIRLFLDKIEVIGRLEKPQAVFIIPGTNPEIDDIRIERQFLNDIFRPVERKGRIVTKSSTEPSKSRKDYIPW